MLPSHISPGGKKGTFAHAARIPGHSSRVARKVAVAATAPTNVRRSGPWTTCRGSTPEQVVENEVAAEMKDHGQPELEHPLAVSALSRQSHKPTTDFERQNFGAKS